MKKFALALLLLTIMQSCGTDGGGEPPIPPYINKITNTSDYDVIIKAYDYSGTFQTYTINSTETYTTESPNFKLFYADSKEKITIIFDDGRALNYLANDIANQTINNPYADESYNGSVDGSDAVYTYTITNDDHARAQ